MNTEQNYKVKLEIFEGPLDLLLYLIKQDEVDIYDISIERITKQYLEYMDAFQVLNIELAGEFIVMAAHLLYIKSRTLLPKDQQKIEEEDEAEDPRWELIRQLIEYRRFKEAARQLRDQESLRASLFPRTSPIPELEVQKKLLVEEISIFDLIHAFQNVLKRKKKTEDSREIFEEYFSVSEKMDHIMAYITRLGKKTQFEELFEAAASRIEIIVTFLALLELIRMRQLYVYQETRFGNIWIASRS